MDRYDSIFEWNMTPDEAKAFKWGCVWEEQTKKFFPDHQGLSHFPRKGDPRKSNLFRYCWRLMRETRGLLREEEYKLFIVANLQILRANNARVEPNALCGDKAWIRWIVWKKLYDIKAKQVAGRLLPEEDLDINPVVVKELALTKKFLFEKCEGEPTFEKIKKYISGVQMRTWVASGKVSQYYIVLSTWVSQSLDRSKLESKYQFDFSLIESKSTPPVRSHFEKEFSYEKI